MDANELAEEIRDFTRDAKIFQEFLKSLDTRKVCEEDSELLAETMDALQVIGTHLNHEIQQALIIGDIDDDTLFPMKATFDRVWSMVQALLKVARKKDRRRHTISTNPEHAAAIAREQTHIKHAEAFQQAQLEQVERDQSLSQSQAQMQQEQRWSTMHPMLQGGKLYEYTDDVLIEERNLEMQKLAEETAALDQMMEQVELEVQVQGEQLDEADVHVQTAHQNVDEGVKTIIATSKSKKYHAITGGGAVVGAGVGVGVGVVLGPAGMVVGGIIGAAVGGAAGFGAGKVIRRKQDMDAFKYHLDNKWVRDEDVKGCRGCGKKFTRTRRRHHCRSCGNIFCNKCTKKRVKLPKVEFYKKVRVCEGCFEEAIHTVTDAAGDEIPADVREAQITGAVPPPDEEVMSAALGSGEPDASAYDRRYSRSIL
mmetsp:Transcript_8270/g.25608  ORF Transcript_8270/g.25608 Transcript_8270/m.25608 type:complete len:424 (-) Transcript_8270:1293-2564(-)